MGGGSWALELLRRRKAHLLLFLVGTGVLVLYSDNVYRSSSSPLPLHLHNLLGGGEEGEEFLVNTPGCKLLWMNPLDSTVTKFLKQSAPPTCKVPLVTLHNQTLQVNKGSLHNWKLKGAKCCYRSITRVTQKPHEYDEDADYTVKLGGECKPIGVGGVVVDQQYVKVECLNNLNLKVWEDYFAVILPPEKMSPATKAKSLAWQDSPSLPPSVLVIGVDSISRLHMLRSLPQTKEWLQNNHFVELKGYTKVGENTFPNIMAAFGGMKSEEWEQCWPNRTTKLDDCPFIWKNFSRLNYITAHVEDSPGIAIFNYDKTGFVEPPTDYYLRPLMVAEHQHYKRGKYSGGNTCLGGGLTPTQLLFHYISQFLDEVPPHAPFFLLSWFTSIAHDDFNGLKHYDTQFKEFLGSALNKVGDNTLLLFISDHGYRFGDFRETFLGFYEESLPFFYIRVPASLKKKFPRWEEALKTNAHRLTSPHDLYSAFVDLYEDVVGGLGMEQRPFKKHGPSLFQVGPLNRTCESSYIPQKFCICGVSPQVSSTELAKEMGDFIVDFVNADLKKNNLSECVTLEYKKFLYGREVGAGEVWNQLGKLEPYRDYLMAVETSPWEGRFEARVRQQSSTKGKELLGSVSRINSYEGKSDCIQDYVMKNFCTCKELWSLEKKRRHKKKHKKKGKG